MKVRRINKAVLGCVTWALLVSACGTAEREATDIVAEEVADTSAPESTTTSTAAPTTTAEPGPSDEDIALAQEFSTLLGSARAVEANELLSEEFAESEFLPGITQEMWNLWWSGNTFGEEADSVACSPLGSTVVCETVKSNSIERLAGLTNTVADTITVEDGVIVNASFTNTLGSWYQNLFGWMRATHPDEGACNENSEFSTGSLDLWDQFIEECHEFMSSVVLDYTADPAYVAPAQ